MKHYRFAFVIPSYNGKKFISEAIDSIFQQPGDDYQLIIVDDGSTDDTQAFLTEQYGLVENLFFYQQQNKGPNVACSKAIKMSNCEYIILMAADDCIRPNYLQTVRSILQENNALDVIFGTSCSVSYTGTKSYSTKKLPLASPVQCFEKFILGKLSVVSCGSLFKRELFDFYINRPPPLPQNYDTVFLAHCMLQYNCYKSETVFVDIHDRGNKRYRNDIASIQNNISIVETMFDPELIGDSQHLQRIKKMFSAKHQCSCGRSFYKANMYSEAANAYQHALKLHPLTLLNARHLRRFAISFIKSISKPSI